MHWSVTVKLFFIYCHSCSVEHVITSKKYNNILGSDRKVALILIKSDKTKFNGIIFTHFIKIRQRKEIELISSSSFTSFLIVLQEKGK